jgi:hypothetical protein
MRRSRSKREADGSDLLTSSLIFIGEDESTETAKLCLGIPADAIVLAITGDLNNRQEQSAVNSGQWKAGQSGNAKGRPTGTGVGKLPAAIAKHVPEILSKLVEAAKAGDVASARLLLARVIPPVRASEESVSLALPDGTLTEQGRAVLAAVANRAVAPTQGAALIAALGAMGKLTETDELTRRVQALEQNRNQSNRVNGCLDKDLQMARLFADYTGPYIAEAPHRSAGDEAIGTARPAARQMEMRRCNVPLQLKCVAPRSSN